MSNNASSNSIRPSRPTINNFSNNNQNKPPIFIHSDIINKKQSNKWNKECNEDDDRYRREKQDPIYHEVNIRRNGSNSKHEEDSRSVHSHHHSPKHYHSHHNSPSSFHSLHSSHSSHFSKSHKSHSRSRSKNHRDRYHSSSTHSHHHSSSQIIKLDDYKPHSHKYKSNSHSSSSSSPSSPKRLIEQQLKPPEINKNVEHNSNTPRDSKLTNILSSSLPLPSPPHSPIIIPTLETANKNEPPSIIQSIHEIVENMKNNKSVDKALSNCAIENGTKIKSQNHYKNIPIIDDNPYFGFSKINNFQYYIENKDKSY